MAQEKQFENKVKGYLAGKKIWFIKTFGCMFQRSGIPDLLICVNGHFVAVELKSETGRASALQLYNIDQINKNNGIAMVLRPNQFEDFKKIIEKLGG